MSEGQTSLLQNKSKPYTTPYWPALADRMSLGDFEELKRCWFAYHDALAARGKRLSDFCNYPCWCCCANCLGCITAGFGLKLCVAPLDQKYFTKQAHDDLVACIQYLNARVQNAGVAVYFHDSEEHIFTPYVHITVNQAVPPPRSRFGLEDCLP